jgi:Uma2 family endonuclease
VKTLKTRAGARRPNGKAPRPSWDIAQVFPEQGDWTVEEYLALTTNRIVEFSHGVLEVPPLPTTLHQWVLTVLLEALRHFTGGWPHLGLALPSALPVRLWEGKFREPDVVFLFTKHKHRALEKYWEGADLAMEVASHDRKSRRRDLVTKRAEYARAGISEYWIVDTKLRKITVLRLKGKAYEVHGVFKNGQTATSRLLPGFGVEVSTVFAGP